MVNTLLALKQAVGSAFATAALLAGTIAVAAPANAVATPAEACGNNYHEIDHQDLKGAVIHLLYNGSTDCVVTTKTSNLGKETWVGAMIGLAKGSVAHSDYGNFDYYAGPVRLTAPGKCIVWEGAVGTGRDSATDVWVSPQTGPRAHCG